MIINFDKKADALYVQFSKGRFHSNKTLDDDTVIDLDKKGQILGIEFLSVSKRLKVKDLGDIQIKVPIEA